MADPIPTNRQTCPLLTAGTVKTSEIVDAVGAQREIKLTPVQCLGVACQWWLHDANLPPETGDCSIRLSALFSATGATQLGLINDNVATLGRLVVLVAEKQGIVTDAPPTQA